MKAALLALATLAAAHLHVAGDAVYNSEQQQPLLDEMWGEAWAFQGINTFAHLPHHTCLTKRDTDYDVAVVGVPFDTATSYRLGARFGPRAVRSASQRQTSLRAYNNRANINPYLSWASVIDCGDIPVTPMDNALAFKQMTLAFEELLLERTSKNKPPRYVAVGGDHSVLLPHLRALHKLYGRINVIHFDAHLDTWKPDKYPSFWHTHQAELTHGSMLFMASEEGLLTEHNVHAGIRTKISGTEDYDDDDEQHWVRITGDDIWLKGPQYVIDQILKTVPKDTPTYVSVDIDVLDPGFGSGTGTQEPGGWLPRELIHVLRGIEDLSVVGADVVEVNPDFDHAEITSTNAAQVVYEIVTLMVKKGPLDFKVNEHPQRTPINAFVDMEPQDALAEKQRDLESKLQKVESLRAKLEAEISQVQKLQMVKQG